MRRVLATRFGFFAFAALVCWALAAVIDREFVWVALATGGLYLVLSLLFLAEAAARGRDPVDPGR